VSPTPGWRIGKKDAFIVGRPTPGLLRLSKRADKPIEALGELTGQFLERGCIALASGMGWGPRPISGTPV